MKQTYLRRQADEVLDGKVVRKIKRWRSDGYAWEWIARELYFESDRRIDLTSDTVKRWYQAESDG